MNSTKYFVTWLVFYGLLVLTGLLGFCTMLLVSAVSGWPAELSLYLPHLLFLVVFLFGMAQLRWMRSTTRKAMLDKQEEA